MRMVPLGKGSYEKKNLLKLIYQIIRKRPQPWNYADQYDGITEFSPLSEWIWNVDIFSSIHFLSESRS